MWPRGVVVRDVPGKHLTEVSLAEDQHLVGDLRSDGQDEAFGEAVRPRTPRWDLDHLDPRVRQDRVERRRELTRPVGVMNGNRARQGLPRSMTSLRACCVVQGPSGCPVTPITCR